MSFSAWIMLIFAVVVLYGGLYVTVSKAAQSSKDDNKEK